MQDERLKQVLEIRKSIDAFIICNEKIQVDSS